MPALSSRGSTSAWRNPLPFLGVLLLRLTSRLPIAIQQALGKGLGRLVYWIFPYRKQVARTNLELCFPEWSPHRIRQTLRRHYEAMGIGLFELGSAWFRKSEGLSSICDVRGLEHLDKLESEGRGVLLLSAHFTTLEIIGRLLLLRIPFSCLYRKPNQPYLARVMMAARQHWMRQVIHFDDVPNLVRALRSGERVWYAPDQGKRMKESAILPFFGVPARTNTATIRLAKMGRAAVVPYFGRRLNNGRYEIEILPEMSGLYDLAPEEAGARINKLIEEHIRQAPEQYFWLHRKFKRRGEGYPDVYAKV